MIYERCAFVNSDFVTGASRMRCLHSARYALTFRRTGRFTNLGPYAFPTLACRQHTLAVLTSVGAGGLLQATPIQELPAPHAYMLYTVGI